MMNRPHARHRFLAPLKVADGHELYLREEPIDRAQIFFVNVMHGVDKLRVLHEAREHQRRHVVQMNDIAVREQHRRSPRTHD